MGAFRAFRGERLVVILLRRVGVQTQIELVPPAELEPRPAQRIVPHLRGRMPLGQISGVGGELVGHHADLHVITVGQAQMLLGRDIAKHRGAVPADHGRADAAGDMVVARRDVGGERPQCVEGRFAAGFELLFHIPLDLVHGHMARPFDHHLHILFPGALGQFAQRIEFGELRLVIGVGDRSGAQAVAQRIGDVIGLHDFANLVEPFVEEALAMVGEAPFRHDGAATRDDAGHALGGHGDIGQPHARMDGEIIDTLFGLFDQRVAENLPRQILGNAADLFERLIDGHGADRHGRIADDPFARVVNVAAG